MALVVDIVKESGRKTLFNLSTGPSDRWCRKFLNKHPELIEKTPESQDKGRARMSNWTVMHQYFRLLTETVKKLELEHRPDQIFNCDESGFSGKEKSRQKVIVTKGSHAYQQNNLAASHITAQLCISASGRILPSFLIFEGNLPHKPFTEGVPSNWLFGSSDSGYMDTELFQQWFDTIFLQNCGSRRPVLLIFDNHDSHISLSFLKKAISNDITILGLPPHTTHILQPLDVAIFGPLKEKVTSLAATVGYLNATTVIGKAKFPALLSTAIDSTCTPARIKHGFQGCGMYPANIEAIDKSQIAPSDGCSPEKKDNETEKEGNQTNEESTSVLCHGCGMSIDVPVPAPVNPLVARGLIPPALGKILVPPPSTCTSTKKKNPKIVTEARVLTGEDVIRQLEEKEKELKRLEEEKENRKIERIKKREEKERLEEERRAAAEVRKVEKEKKKAEQEKEKERKRKIKEKRKERKNNNESDLCVICHEMEPGDMAEDNVIIEWVQCEMCKGWAHKVCVTLPAEDDFLCDDCFSLCF